MLNFLQVALECPELDVMLIFVLGLCVFTFLALRPEPLPQAEPQPQPRPQAGVVPFPTVIKRSAPVRTPGFAPVRLPMAS